MAKYAGNDPFGLRESNRKISFNTPTLQPKYIHYFTPRFVDLCDDTILMEEERLHPEPQIGENHLILVYDI